MQVIFLIFFYLILFSFIQNQIKYLSRRCKLKVYGQRQNITTIKSERALTIERIACCDYDENCNSTIRKITSNSSQSENKTVFTRVEKDFGKTRFLLE